MQREEFLFKMKNSLRENEKRKLPYPSKDSRKARGQLEQQHYVKLSHYNFADESEDYSTVSILNIDKREEVLYQTDDPKVIEELDKVLSLLGDNNVITLSVKNRG